jgi:WD40 repeat protein
MIRPNSIAILLLALMWNPCYAADETAKDRVSFSSDIRPLLVEKCFGCHQPAQQSGGYLMTDFDLLLAGGESEEPAIVPGDPESSRLIQAITPIDGVAEMPPEGSPFSEKEISLIRSWIEEGAHNDFKRLSLTYTSDSPPVYNRQPNVSALDVSPDGKRLAVSGFHEVLLFDIEAFSKEEPIVDLKPKVVHRLIGLSARIESLKFSPDGSRIAVAGGIPGELGEIQIWDVASGEQLLSKTISGDNLYGVDWSPDGNRVSFGGTDTALRVINAISGEEVLFQGAHEDWVRDTVFSVDGSHLVSVGRDMSCKLTEVSTQRFVDNITSITPGALKGGIAAVARHPDRDEVLIGGADGVPKVYRMNRLTKRVIGDDANLIRRFPAVPGRIQSVAISPDGTRLCCGSSLDGQGRVTVFSYEFDSSLPESIRAIVAKRASSQSAQEKQQLEAYVTKDVQRVSSTSELASGIYAVGFHPDGHHIFAGGNDGQIRIVEAETGELVAKFEPVESIEPVVADYDPLRWQFAPANEQTESFSKPLSDLDARRLIVTPKTIEFNLPVDYTQMVVQAELTDGSKVDVTDECRFDFDSSILLGQTESSGQVQSALFQPNSNGETRIEVRWNDLSESVPAIVQVNSDFQPDFIRDVNPVLTKLGCNAGTCHGSQGGKKGFKLSLRGYDPLFDIRAFTDDMACRRVNLAAPDNSLMLLKPTTQVAHQGGRIIEPESRYHHLIRDWIANGARLNLQSAAVESIDILPRNPLLSHAGAIQNVRVVATYSDGRQRDVTREAVVEVGDVEIASATGSKIRALRRGESPILARYEGAYDATTLTVMGNRDGFVWSQPETWGKVDELVSQKWLRMKILPSDLCTDEEFVRRVYLDLTGLPPNPEQMQAFLDDERTTRRKRDALVDHLVGSPDFVEHWSNKWADLLQVNRKYLGAEGAASFREWIRAQVDQNRPYNEFVHEILTASGSNRENPPAAYYKIHRTPEQLMENTTHLFLATRFNCNKCHDHPFERWTQDQYYQTAAFFAQVDRKKDPGQQGPQGRGDRRRRRETAFRNYCRSNRR